jgi:hypothetical protein
LIGIAHHEQIARTLGKRVRDHKLRMIRVLVFVDENPLMPPLQERADFFVVPQEQRDFQEKIIEVDRV